MLTPTQQLDQTDIAILKALQNNARLTCKELAAQIHLSTTPTFERWKRLEREGYIKQYVTMPDAEKLNQGFVVFCHIKMQRIDLEATNNFVKTIRQIPEVTECYNISGKFDYLLKVHSENMHQYQQFIINVIGQISYIASLESTFVMREEKHELGI